MDGARGALLALLAGVAPHVHALERRCHAAAEILAPALLSGPWHTVDPCVRVVGHLWRFEVHTTWGARSVDSAELLATRIEELPAEAALEALGTPELGVRAFGLRAYEHAQRLERAGREPLATIAALPRGALAFFERRLAKLGQRARKYGDRARDAATGGDAFDDAPSLRPGIDASAHAGGRTLAAQTGRELERQARGALSFGATRRRWADRLGVDPYTTNAPLREELERVTWTAIVGETAADAAIAELPGALTGALGVARDVDAYVWREPPEDIARRNGERLAALGCAALETRRVLRNGAFTPTLQTALVEALEALEPRGRCDALLDLASALRGEIEARYLVNALALLDRWAPHPAWRRLDLIGTTPVSWRAADVAVADAGAQPELVLPLAVDRLQWTAATRRFFDDPRLRVESKLAIVSGELSPKAARALTRRGWSIVERAGRR